MKVAAPICERSVQEGFQVRPVLRLGSAPVDLYAKDYGGLGVILAIYFWIALCSAIIVWAASLSPALAVRRDLRRAL